VNREWFQNEAFLVAHADNLIDFVVPGLIAAHRDWPRAM
jgi:mannose-1-phosphate guanylyltransferase